MTEIKSCKTCLHSVGNNYKETVYCNKYRKEEIDYVEGKTLYVLPFCYDLRASKGQCGPEGKGWELRPPEKKMTMLEVIKDFIKWAF